MILCAGLCGVRKLKGDVDGVFVWNYPSFQVFGPDSLTTYVSPDYLLRVKVSYVIVPIEQLSFP
jgi:hypothetical protein